MLFSVISAQMKLVFLISLALAFVEDELNVKGKRQNDGADGSHPYRALVKDVVDGLKTKLETKTANVRGANRRMRVEELPKKRKRDSFIVEEDDGTFPDTEGLEEAFSAGSSSFASSEADLLVHLWE